MPNQPKTTSRNVRVPDETWLPARAIAAERDETLSDVIRAALDEYVALHS